jgi:hypothetical protein
MKTSLQFFKDMGVCDGAYQTLQRVFNQAGVTEFDYAQGYEFMLGMMDTIEADAIASADPDHDTAQGWLEWCYDLRNRPEAIMYFGDHIEENLFDAGDGYLYDTLQGARDHISRGFQELKGDYQALAVVNGVTVDGDGVETWRVIDFASADPSDYDAFVWHDIATGANHRTVSPTVAAAFHANHKVRLDEINRLEQNSTIKRKITDESEEFSVWVVV